MEKEKIKKIGFAFLGFITGVALYCSIVFISDLMIENNIFIEDDCCQCGASNGCCPCPNQEYIDEVSEWYGHEPSSAGSWKYMCDEYKKEMNKTFDCFY